MKTRDLFERWQAQAQAGLNSPLAADEEDWTATELRNALRSIEWDLEDLDDTVQIVERNPAKFRIDPAELGVRKKFIASTRAEVKRMKDKANAGAHAKVVMPDHVSHKVLLSMIDNKCSLFQVALDQVSLSSPPPHTPGDGGAATHGSSKYNRLPNQSDSPTSRGANLKFDQIRQEQLKMTQGQDETLLVMSESVGSLRTIGGHIGNELDEQAAMLDEFGTEIENAESKLDATMKKMSKVLHMSNGKH